jgi:uncharacterized protein with GYD domain
MTPKENPPLKQRRFSRPTLAVKFTDKGTQAAKQATERVNAWAAKVQSMGVTIKAMYWTLGEYDQVCIFEAADDETVNQYVAGSGHAGQRPHADDARFLRFLKWIRSWQRYPQPCRLYPLAQIQLTKPVNRPKNDSLMAFWTLR